MAIALTATAACGSSGSSSSAGRSTGSATTATKGSPTASTAGSTTASTSAKSPSASNSSTAAGARTTLKGMDFCKSLSAASLTAIGVQASDAEPRNKSGRSGDAGCEFKTGETMVGVYAITHWSIGGTSGDRDITISGFKSVEADSLGNSCDESVQVNDDELELNVWNEDSSNRALKGKACDVARDFVKQVVSGVTKK